MLESFVKEIPNYISTTTTTLLIIIGLCIFLGIIVYVMYILSFTRTVIIREIVNGRVKIRKDKAKLSRDSKGVIWYKLRNETDKDKRYMPVPPSGAIDLDDKGREFVEAYRTENGMYIFIKDGVRVAEVPKELYKNIPDELISIQSPEVREKAIKKWKESVLDQWKKHNGIVEAFQPFTTQQRVLVVNSIIDAEERKGKTIWQNIPQIAGIGAVVIIAVCLMIFWGDMAKPVIEAREQQTAQLQLMKEISITMVDMKNDIQTFKTDQESINSRLTSIEKKQGTKGVPN